MICAALGIGQEKRFRLGPPENTSVSIVRYDIRKKEYNVFLINDFNHLS